MARTVPTPLDSGSSTIAWPSRQAALGWFGGGCVLAFAVAWIGADLLSLNRDLYYLVYFTLILSFLAAFLSRTGVDWTSALSRNLLWSVAIGVAIAVPAVFNVLSDPATSRPDGAYFAVEVIWRGVVYGVVDALVLFVFPALVARLLLKGNITGVGRRLGFAGLAMLLVTTMTAAYHLGYSQFRDEDIREPEIGAVLNSVPTFLTANPAGAVIAHTAVHVTAVVHEYDGGNYLPPATSKVPAVDGDAAVLVAAAWSLLTAAMWWRGRRWILGDTRQKEKM